jgi:hypothetical protein
LQHHFIVTPPAAPSTLSASNTINTVPQNSSLPVLAQDQRSEHQRNIREEGAALGEGSAALSTSQVSENVDVETESDKEKHATYDSVILRLIRHWEEFQGDIDMEMGFADNWWLAAGDFRRKGNRLKSKRAGMIGSLALVPVSLCVFPAM